MESTEVMKSPTTKEILACSINETENFISFNGAGLASAFGIDGSRLGPCDCEFLRMIEILSKEEFHFMQFIASLPSVIICKKAPQ